ncbi:uncharacterized protein SCHCODRAFT_02632629 [Schizophyllum commune H4-8]|uniref:uncharacterized protein n=1 Tax=Schizophyllum commune (strain H4-8 / FGSC 9210) TaxID=578458 RepID=UPI00215E3229|nr:uncharacterized protein SCHCODRAFT_02632629 [Schizophyllum commune H4-8]KAI5890695.1 hypothetical protein SCHCODRAFT_02632629 [Schizophyllum commune H4-8]
MVHVKWGREKLSFQLPDPSTRLGDIRQSIAEYTHLPPNAFKLVHSGVVMKDDNAPISAYHIKPNSTIAVIGTADAPPSAPAQQAKPKPAPPRSEQSTINQIQSEMQNVRSSLGRDLETLLGSLPQYHTAGDNKAFMDREHLRLGELLLQSLLRLDGINAESEWQDARRERKESVREVQGLLDRLDGAWQNRGN